MCRTDSHCMMVVVYICCMHDNCFTDLTVPPQENLEAP
jgi:hypothetical protein